MRPGTTRDFDRRRRAAWLAAAGLAASLALAAPARAEAPGPRSISVTGEGEIMASPDEAYVTLGVTSEGPTAAAAMQANSQAAGAVLDSLRRSGAESRDLQTRGLALEPKFEPQPNGRPPKPAGYRAINTVTVHVRDLAKLGGMLDAAVGAGANTVQGIGFGLSDRVAREDEARRKAMADAARRAGIYAQAGGVKLGAVRSVEEEPGGFPQPRPLARAGVMAASAVPIEAGEIGVTVRVRVTYDIAD